MIVKNESQHLGKCLELARPHVEEIVVLDTGSTDGTQAIAQKYADLYDEIPWPGSFAEARNASLDRATGTHIFILDGDEWIEDPMAWARIRAESMRPQIVASFLPVENMMRDGGLIAGERFWQERIFVNHPSIRYHGRVHNQIGDRLNAFRTRRGGKFLNLEAPIKHVGYSYEKEKMKKKYEPRVDLLWAEYHQAKNEVFRSYYAYQLGVVYVIFEEWEQAMELFRRVDFSSMNPHNAFYTHLLASLSALSLNLPEESLQHAEAMLTMNLSEPVAYYFAAIGMVMNGKASDGMLLLIEAVTKNIELGHRARFRLNTQAVVERVATVCERAGMVGHAEALRLIADKPDVLHILEPVLRTLQQNIILGEHLAETRKGTAGNQTNL